MQVFYPSLHLVLVSMMLNSHLDVCSRSWSLPSPMTSDAYGVYAACSTRFLENILVHTGMSCLSSCRMTQWSTPLPAPSMLPWNSVPWVLEMASVHSLKPNNNHSPRLRLNLRERDWARKTCPYWTTCCGLWWFRDDGAYSSPMNVTALFFCLFAFALIPRPANPLYTPMTWCFTYSPTLIPNTCQRRRTDREAITKWK